MTRLSLPATRRTTHRVGPGALLAAALLLAAVFAAHGPIAQWAGYHDFAAC